MIQSNVIHSSYESEVKKLLFIGSSCIYPKLAPQPMKEEYLLTGSLEPTNEPFAAAKIAGIKMCESYARQFGVEFISVIPTNLYGPGDNFDPLNSHVLGALIPRFVSAKNKCEPTVTIWGSGKPLREFLYVDDLAKGLIFIMENYRDKTPINIGSGKEISIRMLAGMVSKLTGYAGTIEFDPTKADGTPRKIVDTTKVKDLGWHPATDIETGLRKTIDWYMNFVYEKAAFQR